MNPIKLNNDKTKIKKIYLGTEILRMILSFLIVVVHFHNKRESKIKLKSFASLNLEFYVPTFFIISFYFSYKLFVLKNIYKIKQRFRRILIPYIIWPIISWIRYNFFNILHKKKDKQIFKNLYYQLLVGDGFYGIFWFLFNLIFHSIIFTIIILLFYKKYYIILQILSILICIYNFLGYNLKIFSKYNHVINHSIKPILECLLYSLTGFFLGSINIIDKLNKYKIIMIYLSLFVYAIIKIKKKLYKYFYNYHIFIIDLVSSIFFIIFACLPVDKIKNKFLFLLIKQITRYTGGVYYLHPEICYLLAYKFNSMKIRGAKECIIIYLVCYLISLIGSLIFRKHNLKYLFI